MPKRPSAVEQPFTEAELAELQAGTLPKGATLVRIRHEALEAMRPIASVETIAAMEAKLREAEFEHAEDCKTFPIAAHFYPPPSVVVLSQTLPNGREQIIFPFAAEILRPSPAGEGRPGSPGSAAASAARVREPSPRGRRAPQGTRKGAVAVPLLALALAYRDALARRAARP